MNNIDIVLRLFNNIERNVINVLYM